METSFRRCVGPRSGIVWFSYNTTTFTICGNQHAEMSFSSHLMALETSRESSTASQIGFMKRKYCVLIQPSGSLPTARISFTPLLTTEM
ncbi:hypothetical protein DPMN_185697 [Dreissena polymorpha]|uniref:Uncharacterized protein n=1 Tax=Dreissena polymorpha TaxID=45954 RepID=A0A9D4I7I7_DREPO|nr:hypothetical protein DPMN_185697 [Dreissena polymorpha]